MKTILIFFIGVIFPLTTPLLAQLNIGVEDSYIVERRPNSEITNITRGDNTRMHKVYYDCKSLEIEKNISFEELYSKVFAKEKVDVLAENDAVISMYFITDLIGNILEIEYKLVRTSLATSSEDLAGITLSEISELEEIIKQHQFKFSESDCPDSEYIAFSKLVRFRYISNYMENREIQDISRFPIIF